MAIKCTCGSGGHPRKCDRHPFGFEAHCARLGLLGHLGETPEAEQAATDCDAADVADMKQRFDLVRAEGRAEALAEVQKMVEETRDGPLPYDFDAHGWCGGLGKVLRELAKMSGVACG